MEYRHCKSSREPESREPEGDQDSSQGHSMEYRHCKQSRKPESREPEGDQKKDGFRQPMAIFLDH